MSMYDVPRADFRQPMGEEMATVDPRLPGGPSTPTTEYRPSAGPRVLPARVRAQRQIDAMSGEALDHRMRGRLDEAMAGMDENGQYMARREMAHGVAVGAHIRAGAAHPAGYLGGGVRLAGPGAGTIQHIMGC
jgi:hypothetical protein